MPSTAIENQTEQIVGQDDNDDDDSTSVTSADEALREMLGFSIFSNEISMEEEKDTSNDLREPSCSNNLINPIEVLQYSKSQIQQIINHDESQQIYKNESICILSKALSIPSSHMRRLADELVYGESRYPSDKSYEKIKYKTSKDSSQIHERRELTRFENFVDVHPGWHHLCHSYIAKCISCILGEEMVLFKEKLNLKPPGGSGFAPHLDTPSLRVSLGSSGPQTFVTVMVAIDDMNEKNGCLKVCRGGWDEEHHVETVEPEHDGNPDAGGRAGAIELDDEDYVLGADGEQGQRQRLKFDSIECKGGDIAVFNGYAPHRSSANTSPFPRRAVFLTYNPKREGEFHRMYYENMKKLREDWLQKMKAMRDQDHAIEMAALQSIPKI